MVECEVKPLEDIYKEHCDDNFDSADKIVTFILRLIVLAISIYSSLLVLMMIIMSKKKQFWPFKLIFCQVISECIDLVLALTFTINSSCWPKACKLIGYFMHSNWLASLIFMLFQCLIYFVLIRSEFLFNLIMKYLYIILAILYLIPYGFLLRVYLDDGFGPSGWYLQNGEFNFIFCGFINHQIVGFWIAPVSTLFFFSILFSIFVKLLNQKQNCCYWHRLQYKKELRYPALRIQSMLLFPLLYFLAWLVNFLIRLQDTDSNDQNYCPQDQMNYFFYIFYQVLNLGFELHLTVGAILFFYIYKQLTINVLKRTIWDNFFE
ncbi:unnamed protein product (macronuclear) [Paramecium tetraurelia]|uniref:G-protein coupled receptors family 2 profile 2 domain-containing protein n=1 Tax=Paramecium tetraurelia TaxID=5888 RepID=A0D902_PARTE|nr:uncharacterized protein GSPATT00014465001 [Paramecium tetraurelia]CAK79519.1 unnamed protein product [Paramecium tetraurelia]|eukprot:XP_001446916.1 hypothetical protein (macronuclear) [Paramecium tetraurelia strain d4-2]